jgi:hypothetical protein
MVRRYGQLRAVRAGFVALAISQTEALPAGELIERICRDLGLTADASARVGQAWGSDEAEARDGRLAEQGAAIPKAALENAEMLKAELRANLDARLARNRSP